MAADAAIPLCSSRTHRPRRGVAPHRGGDVNADVSVPPRVPYRHHTVGMVRAPPVHSATRSLRVEAAIDGTVEE
jgi:hypothetical protein